YMRFLQALLSLLILGSIVFVLARLTGNPVDLLLPADATEADRQYMIHQLGLDRPYPIQFYEFITNALRGDLGKSIRFGRPATELFMERLPNSLRLAGVAFLFAILAAIPLGVLAGSHRATNIDSATRLFSVIGIAAPSFWVGLVLMDVFAVRLGVLPAARMGGIDHYILPAFSLSFFVLAGMTRLLRSSVVENMDSEFVKLARIKGVSSTMVIWKHVLRNSLIPVLTFAGMYLGLLLSGAIVIETVFAWPGVGRLAYEGIIFRDYPLVQSVVMIKGAMIIGINLLVDILYSYVDPRIRYGS
ncbi:MAG: ABC transporter permease, partial [Dehalococcoidia bacterium]|nr:ABC transporter permease [Dehalococcoidia bacterium]